MTQASASTTLDLPEPLGPKTAVIPGSKRTVVEEAKDLKPRSVRLFNYTRVLLALRPLTSRTIPAIGPQIRYRRSLPTAIRMIGDHAVPLPADRPRRRSPQGTAPAAPGPWAGAESPGAHRVTGRGRVAAVAAASPAVPASAVQSLNLGRHPAGLSRRRVPPPDAPGSDAVLWPSLQVRARGVIPNSSQKGGVFD